MIDLPDYPAPASAQPAMIDFGGTLTPSLGGPVQRINRMGSRTRLSVSMPPMNKANARKWVNRLMRGKSEGVRMPFPLLDFNPGLPGSVLVNGASQSGSSLIVDGATPNYPFREGQPFSVLTGGKHYLHWVTAETIASNTGTATMPIVPMLRLSPADNSVCYFGRPMIEGFILGEEWSWQMSVEHIVGIEFVISESA